ncbi:hypothetical protein ACOMHN_000807 [Nucella lapillus]
MQRSDVRGSRPRHACDAFTRHRPPARQKGEVAPERDQRDLTARNGLSRFWGRHDDFIPSPKPVPWRLPSRLLAARFKQPAAFSAFRGLHSCLQTMELAPFKRQGL